MIVIVRAYSPRLTVGNKGHSFGTFAFPSVLFV